MRRGRIAMRGGLDGVPVIVRVCAVVVRMFVLDDHGLAGAMPALAHTSQAGEQQRPTAAHAECAAVANQRTHDVHAEKHQGGADKALHQVVDTGR